MSLLNITGSQRAEPKPAHVARSNVRSGPAHFPGIASDAKSLGVSRQHLYFVLTGKRTSARLLQRYQAHVARALKQQAA